MGAVKRHYLETWGRVRSDAVLADYARGASWEDDVREALRTGRINTSPRPQRRDLQTRLTRGKGLFRQGRRGIVKQKRAGRFTFQVQTTAEFRRNRWPLDSFDGYHGYIVIKDGQLVGGHCDCPDEGAEWRGFTLCKHMIWAAYRVREGCYELDTHAEGGACAVPVNPGQVGRSTTGAPPVARLV